MDDIKAVVFDLYGTLVHIADELRPYSRLFRELNLTLGESRLAKKVALTENLGLAVLAERIRPDAQIDLRSYEDELSRELDSVKLYPEAVRVLEGLKGKGVSTCVISNLASPYRKPFFALGLNGLVDYYVFSCEAGFKKPNPAIYRQAIVLLGVEPRNALMVGDRVLGDVHGPKFIGMNAVLLDRDGKSRYPVKISSLDEVFSYC